MYSDLTHRGNENRSKPSPGIPASFNTFPVSHWRRNRVIPAQRKTGKAE